MEGEQEDGNPYCPVIDTTVSSVTILPLCRSAPLGSMASHFFEMTSTIVTTISVKVLGKRTVFFVGTHQGLIKRVSFHMLC